jgi:aspartate-semialdehyde dehydrogenase
VPIDGNVLPIIGPLDDAGVSGEEAKMERELRKILGEEDLEVSALCARVPVARTHCEAVHLRLKGDLGAETAVEALRAAPGVRVTPPEEATPLGASGRDDVRVSRVRNAPGRLDGLDLWVAGDQLLKGAALNAVQIAEHLLARDALSRGERSPWKGTLEWT